MLRDTGPGHEQHVGVARAGDELDAEPLDVVVGIVERVDLELAAVARTGVDLADRSARPRVAQDLALQRVAVTRSVIGGGGARLGDDAGAGDLLEDFAAWHQRSCPL